MLDGQVHGEVNGSPLSGQVVDDGLIVDLALGRHDHHKLVLHVRNTAIIRINEQMDMYMYIIMTMSVSSELKACHSPASDWGGIKDHHWGSIQIITASIPKLKILHKFLKGHGWEIHNLCT